MEPDAADDRKGPSGDGSPPASAAEVPAEEKAGAEQEQEREEGEVKEEKVVEEKKRRGRKKKKDVAGEEKAGDEEVDEKKVRKRKRSAAAREAATLVERPSRERKAVERYSATSPRSASTKKSVSIVQGSGTKLRDIPNVSFKLSKRKVDEILQALHTLLYGRKSNAHFLKRNISQFSGFVWTENEEKQKARVKEKLDKCNKEKLLAFCEVLDIQVNRVTTRKEEISAKLLEFLESPYVTRDVVLAEMAEKGKKRGRRKEVNQGTPDIEAKKQRKSHKQTTELEKENEDEIGSDDLEGVSMGKDNEDLEEEKGRAESEEEKDEDEQEEPPRKKVAIEKSTQKGAGPRVKEKMSSDTKSAAKKLMKSPKVVKKKAAAEDKPDSEPESKLLKTSKEKETRVKKDSNKSNKEASESSRRKRVPRDDSRSGKGGKRENQNKSTAAENNKQSKKHGAKVEAKSSTKKQGKGKANVDAKVPSTEELHAVVSDILKEVDFNTATLADILRQLGAHFKMDLMDRKAEVKGIIEEVINSMSDDSEEDEDEDAEDAQGGEDAKGDSDGEENK